MSNLSREAVGRAAIDLADAEGIEAVSMRKVAARMGVGTMSLYHYVRTKEDLFSLMGNAIMGEFLVPPEEMPDDWRGGLRAIALRTKAAFDRHPWMLLGMLQGEEGPPGENVMRHGNQTFGTLAAFDLPPAERLHLTGTVDEYVMGHVFRKQVERIEQEQQEHFGDDMKTWFEDVIASGEFPHFRALFGERDPTADDAFAFFQEMDAIDRFEQGLDLVLDGIGVALARHGAA
ncbi:hypothetical protein DSM112329_04467 [Paraconexibacter sp. AEG42_29]|uniref:HTH tetR-type domain-containing protein n=1 Tax=Paraconexibacter sp. AEG42_29 TaxID=2997339 RepID=A0AAU7B1U0_9ACTN